MDCILSILMLCKIDNIHYERVTDCTDSTLHGYNIMSIVCTLYGYQDSALNHMQYHYNPLWLADFVAYVDRFQDTVF